jgi:hypothetical protein
MKKTIVFTVFAMALALFMTTVFATTTQTTMKTDTTAISSTTATGQFEQAAQARVAKTTTVILSAEAATQCGIAIEKSVALEATTPNGVLFTRNLPVIVGNIGHGYATVTALASTNLAPTPVIRSVNYISAANSHVAGRVLRL